MQADKIAKLSQLIQTSPLFRENERAEWIAMLELMNDKQVMELEELLRSVGPIRPIAFSANQHTTEAGALTGQLKHITNLPERLDFGQPSASKTVTTSALPQGRAEVHHPHLASPLKGEEIKISQAWQEQFKLALQEKELVAPHWTGLGPARADFKSQPKPAWPKDELTHGPQGQFAAKPPAFRQEEIKPQAVLEKLVGLAGAQISAVTSAQASPNAAGGQSFTIRDLDDAAKIDVNVFRKAGYDQLVKILRELVRKTDYFDVSFRLEQSPLYKAYLNTGKKLLELEGRGGALPQAAAELSRAEFEKVADLLRAIQVN